MKVGAAIPYFDKRAVEQVRASLPKDISQWRLERLPLILNLWRFGDLREHLSRESRATLGRRYEQIKKVGERAKHLRQASIALDQSGWDWIAQEMVREGGDRFFSMEGETPAQMEEWHRLQHETLAEMKERLRLEDDFLMKLEAATQRIVVQDKQGPGQPRNVSAYLVMMDLAAVFEWLTGKKATRVVDRITNDETGSFWDFAAAVWPLVFGNGCHGLRAAMKNWAELTSELEEKSQLMQNIALALDQPEWGIFDALRE